MTPQTEAVVLVVEDQRSLADLYSAWLSGSYTVKTAYGGQDALDQLDTSVDIVLLDRRMSDYSGDRVLETIDERDFDCQVALVTSVEPDTDILRLGFDDYLCKPINKPTLLTLVESLCVRLTYSQSIQEYFSLVSKRVALRVERGADDLATDPKTHELDAQIRDRRADLDGLLAEFTNDDFRAAFYALSSPTDVQSEFGSLS